MAPLAGVSLMTMAVGSPFLRWTGAGETHHPQHPETAAPLCPRCRGRSQCTSSGKGRLVPHDVLNYDNASYYSGRSRQDPTGGDQVS